MISFFVLPARWTMTDSGCRKLLSFMGRGVSPAGESAKTKNARLFEKRRASSGAVLVCPSRAFRSGSVEREAYHRHRPDPHEVHLTFGAFGILVTAYSVHGIRLAVFTTSRCSGDPYPAPKCRKLP
jgi:hypothetical protein